jgi:hypothetical protein
MKWIITIATQDKENVPPSFAQKPTRKQIRFNICNIVNKTRGKWTNEALEEAMDVIEGGIISLRKASRHWNIPLPSLSDHVYGKTTFRKLGIICVLTKEKDQVMVVWLNDNARSWIVN